MVSSSLEKINDLIKSKELYETELSEREALADLQLKDLPELMNGMFD